MRHCLQILAGAILACSLVFPAFGQDAQWKLIEDADTLRRFMSGLKVERRLPSGELTRGEYRTDGTGTVYAWGAERPRTWSIPGNDRVCITADRATACYRLQRNAGEHSLLRSENVSTGELAELRVTDGRAVVVDDAAPPGGSGGAASVSADELAAELSNPNTSVATLTLKNQFRWFDGDLPGAGSQSGFSMLFQPALPFALPSGDKIIWRPAVPLLFDQPVFDAARGGFDGEAGLGDIAFDLAYAPRTDPGLLIAYGLITSLPTATNDLGSDRWTLGPELLVGRITKRYVVGLFPNHQWDIAGSGDTNISLTTIQPFFTYLPGGGWSVGTGPSVTYDWEAEQWSVPLQLNAGKTVVLGGRPWKLSVELNYYVERPDAFGPEWMLSLNVAPVVKNGLASLFGL